MTITAQHLLNVTSIATMGCDSVADLERHQEAVRRNAEKVDAGLLTFQEARRAVFDNK